MIVILELVSNNEEMFILIYLLFILWINVDYLKEFKKIKRELTEVTTDEELIIDPGSVQVMILGLVFNFIRRWLFYILAVLYTENILVIILAVILFVISLYDTLYNYKLEKVKTSNIGLYLAIIDTVFIIVFAIYLI